MAEKRIIKASEIEGSGINVEKADYVIRKFDDKVYKSIPLDEPPVAMEENAGLAAPRPDDEAPGDSEKPQVSIERFHGDDGELTGLKITCRCGEVIELEFTREQDELPPADSSVAATAPVAGEQPPPPEPEAPVEQSGQQDPQVPADDPEAEEQKPQ